MLDPDSASIRASEARFLLSQGDLDGALEKSGEALERYPTHLGHRLLRAEILLKKDSRQEARVLLEETQQLDLPVWEYQRKRLNELRQATGLPPLTFPDRD